MLATLPRMTTLRNLIDGVSCDAASGATYDVVNPATGQAYATAPASGAEDVDRAMKAAERAFETWGESTPKARQEALLKIAQALEDRAEEFVRVECENTGKPIGLTAEEEPAAERGRACASTPAPRGSWRDAARVSTSRTTPPGCAASRSASWRR
ncbi:aldehyde dehydrogenase family protein [Nocardioides convexus]|uniref:aldehyde dehydrogenase family protein n=1 Tax=Nocardioides convexus TaxID=2712224 RepID=UPI0024182FBF|nr:aldehyde dehydrogenase family protein [Nocardioides convexus]